MASSATNRQRRTISGASRARARTRQRPAGQPSEQEKRRIIASRNQRDMQAQGTGESRSTASRKRASAAARRAGQGSASRKQTKRARPTASHARLQPQDAPERLFERTSDYRQLKREKRDPFASTIQKSHIWLKEIMQEIGTQDEHRAHLALKAVLQTLRDRLPVEEVVQLGAQLPELIRGMYYEGWAPAGKPIKYNRVEFVDVVRKYFQHLSGINHQDYIRGVYDVLSRHVSEGELKNVLDTLPEDLAGLFGREAVRR